MNMSTQNFQAAVKDDVTNHVKFDPRLAEKLDFCGQIFLFERKSLQNFLRLYEQASALEVFLNIRPFITKTNIKKVPDGSSYR